MSEKTCETCRWRGRFYKPADHGVTVGDPTYMCRRRAPFVTGGLHAPTMTVWPWIHITDWCGEHQPKDTPHDQ